MDCLVLGGLGYLGSRIIDHFSLKNKITIGSNSYKCEKIDDFEIIKNYRELNYINLLDLLSNYDLVIDCSGISGSKIKTSLITEIMEINTYWPTKLAKACLETNTRLVWFSSIHCENLISNKQKSLRGNIYGISKN